MSGGVDSSVATALLAEQGYECIGCTLRLFDGTDAAADGPAAYDSPNDSIYARSVAWSAFRLRRCRTVSKAAILTAIARSMWPSVWPIG